MPKKIDKKSGSISYNRFEYQITQALNLAISLYDKYNYLIILEHYDDITLFENNNNIKDIHHYQVKTKNVQYTKFEKILKEGFLDNLIGHLNDNNINDVKEISLIINCRIIIDKKKYEIDTIIKPDTTNNILSKIEDIKKSKGFSKEQFNNIMRMSIKISAPAFSEIEKYVKFNKNEIPQYKISYVDILETEYWNSDYNIKILELIEEFIKNNEFNKKEETIIEYSKKCKTYISNNEYYLDSKDDNKHIELICMILMYNKHIKGI